MHDPQNNMHDVHDPITKLPPCDNFLTFSSADVTLFVSSERTRCFTKQMVECRFRSPKTSEEEETCVASAIPR